MFQNHNHTRHEVHFRSAKCSSNSQAAQQHTVCHPCPQIHRLSRNFCAYLTPQNSQNPAGKLRSTPTKYFLLGGVFAATYSCGDRAFLRPTLVCILRALPADMDGSSFDLPNHPCTKPSREKQLSRPPPRSFRGRQHYGKRFCPSYLQTQTSQTTPIMLAPD